MPDFESGVKSYIKGVATITVGFPVDFKDRKCVACRYCPYLSSNERMCQLNKMPVAYPKDYVGDYCPLEILETEGLENDG